MTCARSRRWIRVGLTGIKNLRLAHDEQVEIKAGALYRKQMYSGLPLLFDLGGYQRVDVVRITWPNGLIQNDTNQVDGWAKDRDPNTAFSTTVEPLPFHKMSRYPYPGTERFPQDAPHQRYLKQYITRPALRLICPLENGS